MTTRPDWPTPHAMNDRFDVLASTPRFQGRIFGVRTDDVRYGDGSTHRLDIVEHPGSFAIVASDARDRLVLVRQYRHPARRSLWELPAGTAEPGEHPQSGALRELEEETGYRAGRIRRIASLFATPGFCEEVLHLFFATDLQAGEQSLDEDERIEVGHFTVAPARALAWEGQIADAKTALALLWLQGERGEINR